MNEDGLQAQPPASDGRTMQDADPAQQPSVGPEPPVRYNPQQQQQTPPVYVQPPSGQYGQDFSEELGRIKRQVTIAQVCALVSLIIGGVLLSTVAIIIAINARSKARSNAVMMTKDAAAWEALAKSARVAIVLAVAALALNAITLVAMYPAMLEMLQTADGGSLFGSAGQGTSAGGSGTSTWG